MKIYLLSTITMTTHALLTSADRVALAWAKSILEREMDSIPEEIKGKVAALLQFIDGTWDHFTVSCEDVNAVIASVESWRLSLMNIRWWFKSHKARNRLPINPNWDNVKKILGANEVISERDLWLALKLTRWNENCTFEDIRFMLGKAVEINTTHLGMALEVAKRDKDCTFEHIQFMLAKAVEIDSGHKQIICEIQKRKI